MGMPPIAAWKLFTLLVVVPGTLAVDAVAFPSIACAKGVPTIAKVTSSGLDRVIRSSGPDFPAPVGYWPLPALTGAHHYKAANFAASSGPVEYDDAPDPEVELGPRYEVVFFVWKERATRVTQYVYPFAASGPLTFTPSGQSRAFAHVFSEREIRGWWSAPNELTGWFRRHGIAAPDHQTWAGRQSKRIEATTSSATSQSCGVASGPNHAWRL